MEQKKTSLQELHQRVMRKKHVTARIDQLIRQQRELTEKVETLKAAMISEQADVERLQERSLANFFYQVVGKMDEKLSKEQVEAYAAEVRYDAAVQELKAVTEDWRKNQTELEQLANCEEEYLLLFQERAAEIRNAGTEETAELLQVEENIAYLKNQLKEVDEALTAGQHAKTLAESVIGSLESAEGYGIWDVFGGGLLADALKYEQLNDAQERIETLQVQLRRFKTELADVTIHGDMRVNVDSFLQFADYFFDGLFADWTVLEEIRHSLGRVKDTRAQVIRALSQLTNLQKSLQQELDKEVARKDLLIVGGEA